MLSTEPIGSLPRSVEIINAVKNHASDGHSPIGIEQLYRKATQQTIIDLENTGSPIISDGEQSKPSYLTYSLAGLDNVEQDGVVVRFVDGHGRRLPRLTNGPFSYIRYAGDYVAQAKLITNTPFKQAVISPAAVFLIYPKSGIQGYSPNEFLNDVIGQSELDIRSCFGQNCNILQIDLPEVAMSIRVDPSGELLQKFIAFNNILLDKFSPIERACIGVHICTGCDHGSSFCTEEEYIQILKEIFKLHVDKLYLPLQKFTNKDSILRIIHKYMNPWNKIYLGVVDVRPNAPLPTPLEISTRIKRISKYIPFSQLGTTDDCGFASFADSDYTDRTFALKSIKARVQGTAMFESQLSFN